MAKGKRPGPFRTRKLSLSAPMVLHGRLCWESRTSPDILETEGALRTRAGPFCIPGAPACRPRRPESRGRTWACGVGLTCRPGDDRDRRLDGRARGPGRRRSPGGGLEGASGTEPRTEPSRASARPRGRPGRAGHPRRPRPRAGPSSCAREGMPAVAPTWSAMTQAASRAAGSTRAGCAGARADQ